MGTNEVKYAVTLTKKQWSRLLTMVENAAHESEAGADPSDGDLLRGIACQLRDFVPTKRKAGS